MMDLIIDIIIIIMIIFYHYYYHYNTNLKFVASSGSSSVSEPRLGSLASLGGGWAWVLKKLAAASAWCREPSCCRGCSEAASSTGWTAGARGTG